MKLRHVLSRQATEDSRAPPRRHVPWISSPVEKPRYNSVESDGTPAESSVHFNDSMLDFEMPGKLSSRDVPVFKKHHEASSIELFYDLFFVANLATFTANHEIEDRVCTLQ